MTRIFTDSIVLMNCTHDYMDKAIYNTMLCLGL